MPVLMADRLAKGRKMPSRTIKLSGTAILVLLLTGTVFFFDPLQSIRRPSEWAVRITGTGLDNLHKIDEGLYRSEQPDREGFAELYAMNVRSVLNFRTQDRDREISGGLPFEYHYISMLPQKLKPAQITRALRVIKAARKPLLIHCKKGADRAGAVSAAYRMVGQNWPVEAAIREMTQGGYGFNEEYANIPRMLRKINWDKSRKKVLGNNR